MKEYVNFYENIKEARMRLMHTVVMYDGEPYYVLAITDHKGDGVFRMYLDKLSPDSPLTCQRITVPYEYAPGDNEDGLVLGQQMDKWLDEVPKKHKSTVIRKMMNSPLFNKFRPFPLGMCNTQGGVTFAERSPTRHTQQGLTQSMVYTTNIFLPTSDLDGSNSSKKLFSRIDITSCDFYDTIMGNYPDVDECLSNLCNPRITNSAAAFHRHFALVRGPVDMLFLAYKTDIVGVLPHKDISEVVLGKKFSHVREAVEDLKIFSTVES